MRCWTESPRAHRAARSQTVLDVTEAPGARDAWCRRRHGTIARRVRDQRGGHEAYGATPCQGAATLRQAGGERGGSCVSPYWGQAAHAYHPTGDGRLMRIILRETHQQSWICQLGRGEPMLLSRAAAERKPQAADAPAELLDRTLTPGAPPRSAPVPRFLAACAAY